MPGDPLARVRLAADARRRADEEYRSAIRAARDAGVSFTDMGRVAGVTKQAVRQFVTRRLG